MNPAAISFVISFLIAAFLSGENRRFGAFVNINSVLSQLSWDPWHVGWLPSEDIFVVPKKVGEREFLFCREVSADSRCLGGVACA